jgi:type II secretory pathway component PulF
MAFEISEGAVAAPIAPARALARRLELRLPRLSRAVGVRERMTFTEQLALLLETGVSLHEALRALREQAQDPRLAAVFQSLHEDVTEGKPFSLALAAHPEMFSQTYVSLVAAAEEGGFLQKVLQQLLEIDEKNSRLQSVLASALSYPLFLIVFSLAVVVFVLLVIVPKFRDLFESIYDQLPLVTRILMAVSEFLAAHWLLSLVALVAGAAGLSVWIKSPTGEWLLDNVKLRAPIVGDIFVQVYLNQTLNVLGLALISGVPVTTALKASQEVIANRRFAKFLEAVREEVNNGRGLAGGFQKTAFIPPMVREMIATAERTGELGTVMMRIADFYGRELSRRIAILAKVAEPFMLMIMGVVVGVLVAALILPIFKLSRALH